MKRFFAVFLSVCLLSGFVYGQKTFDEVNSLVNPVLFPEEIQFFEKDTVSYDEEDAYAESLNDFDVDASFAFILNVVPGFGVGSFIQGDYTGGKIALFGQLCSVAAFAFGGLNMAFGAPFMIFTSDVYYMEISMIHFIGGMVCLAGFEIFTLIRPWVYGSRKSRAEVEKSVRNNDFAFAPIINPVSKSIGLAAQIKL